MNRIIELSYALLEYLTPKDRENIEEIRKMAAKNRRKSSYSKKIGTYLGGDFEILIKFDYEINYKEIIKILEEMETEKEELEKKIFNYRQNYNLY